MKVVKRDGRIVNFDKQYIVNAILKAMSRTEQGQDVELANKIATSIEDMKNTQMEVEQIQDLVIRKLLSSKRKDVGIEYVGHRRLRTFEREKNNDLSKKIEDIMQAKNVENSNANVDEASFSGKENKAMEEVMKKYALDNLISEKVATAHKDNMTYVHDLPKYGSGMHNCIFIDMKDILNKGFSTRNGDVRKANSISTAMQLVAVIFQCQSQVMFGGVGNNKIDFDLSEYVKISFRKHWETGFKYLIANKDNPFKENEIYIDNDRLIGEFEGVYDYALEMTTKECMQGAQALYHNLNTLESRSGSQVPFTSINFGTDTTTEGRMIIAAMLNASIEGIGRFKMTSIFPISIFKYKKGINDKVGTPNYDMKQLAIKSLTKRIYPNFVNCDYSGIPSDGTFDGEAATMGCRTMLGQDRFSTHTGKSGRGNVSPMTMILPEYGLKHGIAKGERDKPDLEGFWNTLNEYLELTAQGLYDRFLWQSSQLAKSAPFMYENGIWKTDKPLSPTDTVYEALKHGSIGLGYLGLAECLTALFGKHHGESIESFEFGLQVVKHIHEFCKEESERRNLNYGCYATPAEGLSHSALKRSKAKHGIIKGVTDKEFFTNSHHIPVDFEVSILRKLEIEAPFTKYTTAGSITYVELESAVINNPKAVEKIIDYAMELDIPYVAINFPIDTCLECGYQGEISASCPKCKSVKIQRLARVTGYLSTDYRNFNLGKQKEVESRVKHSKFSDWSK